MLWGALDSTLIKCGDTGWLLAWRQTFEIKSKINGLIGVEGLVSGFRVEMNALL